MVTTRAAGLSAVIQLCPFRNTVTVWAVIPM